MQSEELRKIQDEFQLLLHTETIGHSPAIIEIISLAFGGAQLALGIVGAIRNWVERWKQRKELYNNLFGFCANADFFTNKGVINELKKHLEKGKEIYDIRDLDATIRLFEPLISNIFAHRPERPKEIQQRPVNFENNLVSIGGPCRNQFSRWIMKITEPSTGEIKSSNIPTLTYTFNFGLPKLPVKEEEFKEHLDRTHQQEEWQPSNFPISKDGVDLYIPEVYYHPPDEAGECYTCTRDYGMLVKMKSIHTKGRRKGMKNMVMAGCHGYGTQGVAMALGEEDILKEIWEKVGEQDFQAVLAVIIEERKPQRVELLNIVPIEYFGGGI